jgi:hypothetical protein
MFEHARKYPPICIDGAFFHLGGLRRPEQVVLEGHAAGIEQLSGCDVVWGGPVSAAEPARFGAGKG